MEVFTSWGECVPVGINFYDYKGEFYKFSTLTSAEARHLASALTIMADAHDKADQEYNKYVERENF